MPSEWDQFERLSSPDDDEWAGFERLDSVQNAPAPAAPQPISAPEQTAGEYYASQMVDPSRPDVRPDDQRRYAQQLARLEQPAKPNPYNDQGILVDADVAASQYRRGKAMDTVPQRERKILDSDSSWLGRTLSGGLSQAGHALAGTFGRLIGEDEAASQLQAESQAEQAAYARVDPSWGSGALRGSVSSLAQAIPAAAMAGPAGPIALFSAEAGNEALSEAENAGLTGASKYARAARAAAIEGGVTALFQTFGMGGLESVVAGNLLKKQALKEAAKALGHELAEEEAIYVLDAVDKYASGVDAQALDKDKFLAGVLDVAGQTGLTMGAVQLAKKAASWAAANPAEAQQLVKEPSPSRTAFEKAGLGDEQMPAPKRAEFVQAVKETLGVDENPQEADPGVYTPEEVDPDVYTPEEADASSPLQASPGAIVGQESPQPAAPVATKSKRVDRSRPSDAQVLVDGLVRADEKLAAGKQVDALEYAALEHRDEIIAAAQQEGVQIPESLIPATPTDGLQADEVIDLEPVKSKGLRQPDTEQPIDLEPVRPKSKGLRVIPEPILREQEPMTLGSMGGSGSVALDLNETGLSKGPSPIAGFLKRNATTLGDLPQGAFEAKLRMEGRKAANMTEALVVARKFNRAVQESQGTKITPEQAVLTSQVLAGEADASRLPDKIRDVTAEMRDNVDAFSSELIRIGAAQGELAAVLDAGKRTYMRRQYKMFTERNYAKTIKPEDINLAVSGLRAEMKGATEAEIQGALNRILDPQADNVLGALANLRKTGAKNLNIFKHRGELPLWLRRVWGEQQGPVENYVGTVISQSDMVADHLFLKEVLNDGLKNKYIFDVPTGRHHVRLAAKNDWSYSPLNGKYTTPEIAAALNQVGQSGIKGDGWFPKVVRGLMKVVGASREAKTVGNMPTGPIRNFIGNIGIEVANGRVGTTGLDKAARATWDSLRANETEFTNFVTKLQRMGLPTQDLTGAELSDLYQNVNNRQFEVSDMLDKTKVGQLKAVRRGMQKVYQAGDLFWKIRAVIYESEAYKAAYPEWTQDQALQKGVDIARNTTTTDAMTVNAVRQIRKMPLADYIGFTAEVIRVTGKSIALTASELKNPRTRAIGARRLAGNLAAASVVPVACMVARHISGINKDEEEVYRKSAAPWERNASILWLGRDGAGKGVGIDLSFTDPHQYFRKPIMALIRGEDPAAAIADAAKEAMAPFLQPGMVTSAILDVLGNDKPSGGRLYNPKDPVSVKSEKIARRLWDSVSPGTIAQLERIYKGELGQVSDTGKVYDREREIANMITGFRVRTFDVGQSLFFKALAYRRETEDSDLYLRTILGNSGNVSPDAILRAKAFTEYSRQELFNQIVEDVHGAMRVGILRTEVIDLLKKAKMSPEERRRVLHKKYKAYKPGDIKLRKKLRQAEADDADDDSGEFDPWN